MYRNIQKNKNSGMTLVEVLTVMGIFVVVMLAVNTFAVNIFKYRSRVSGTYESSQNAQVILKKMLAEIRAMSPAADGSFALTNAGSTTLAFFSDADDNGTPEKITYTLMGNALYRAVIHPTGNPPVYNFASQSTSTLVVGVLNGNSIPVFQYFDTNYSGTSTPLSQPVSLTTIRLLKVSLNMLASGAQSTSTVTYTVQANLRNLKTNL